MTGSYLNLLRRTLVLLGAAAGFTAASDVLAQGTVTLSGATGNNCSYSAMSISPNGSVTVQCSGGGSNNPPTNPGAAFFTLSGPTTIAPSTPYTTGEFKVTRTDTSGPASTVAFGYTVTGTGCNFTSQGPFWLSPNGSQNLSVTTTASGSCTITLTIQEGHNGSSAASWTVGTTNPNPNPVTPPGCPAPAAGAMDRTDNIGTLGMSGSGVDQLRMGSGTIAYYRVPAAPNPSQSVLIYLTQGQQPNLPAGFVTEMSVSKCPGVIEVNNTPCYQTSVFANANSIGIYTAPVAAYGWNSQESIGGRGCYAPVATATHYVNIRWTYPTCPWGNGNCGTSLQWAPTGSNY